MADQLQTIGDNLRLFVATGRLGCGRGRAPLAFAGCISGLGGAPIHGLNVAEPGRNGPPSPPALPAIDRSALWVQPLSASNIPPVEC
jgi:hypothetical protein